MDLLVSDRVRRRKRRVRDSKLRAAGKTGTIPYSRKVLARDIGISLLYTMLILVVSKVKWVRPFE